MTHTDTFWGKTYSEAYALIEDAYNQLPQPNKDKFDRIFPDYKTITDMDTLAHAYTLAMRTLDKLKLKESDNDRE